MGLTEKDLQFVSFDKFIMQNNEIKSLSKELQHYKYNKFEENRKNYIEEAKKKRKELKDRYNLRKSISSSNILIQGEKLLNNEKKRQIFIQKQKIGEILNIIDWEYKKMEYRQKKALQDELSAQREEEIKEKERIEYGKKERERLLKLEKRSQYLKDEFLKREKEREEEQKKLLLRSVMRRQEEEKERKEKQNEQKLKEEEMQKRIDDLFKNQVKKIQNIEKQLLLKQEIQKKHLEEIKYRKDREMKARAKSTERKIQKCIRIMKLKTEERQAKHKLLFLKRQKLIEDKLKFQKELDKKEMSQKLIQSAIKQEEIEDNIRKIERKHERNRLKILYEIEEKDKRINFVKSQRQKILEEQKKLSKDFEEKREQLIKKFELIMAKRYKKSKGDLIKEIFDDNYVGLLTNRNPSNYNINSLLQGNKSVGALNFHHKGEELFLTNLSSAKVH